MAMAVLSSVLWDLVCSFVATLDRCTAAMVCRTTPAPRRLSPKTAIMGLLITCRCNPLRAKFGWTLGFVVFASRPSKWSVTDWKLCVSTLTPPLSHR